MLSGSSRQVGSLPRYRAWGWQGPDTEPQQSCTELQSSSWRELREGAGGCSSPLTSLCLDCNLDPCKFHFSLLILPAVPPSGLNLSELHLQTG